MDNQNGNRGGAKRNFSKPGRRVNTSKPGGRAYAPKPYANKTRSDKPFEKSKPGERPFGKKPYGDKLQGERSYGKKSFGGKPQGERSYGKKSFGDKPQGERSFGKKPYGDKPQGERSFGKKPYGDKPQGERSYGKKPYGDKPQGERSYGKKPYGDKPQGERSFGKKPYGDKPQGERSYGKKPFGDKPQSERSYGKKPYGDKPQSERSFVKKPYGDKPQGERSFGNKPYGDKPQGGRSYGNKPYGDKPQGERSYGNKPYGDKPQGERSYGNKPYGDKPQGERPYGKKPFGDKPQGERAYGNKVYDDKPQGERRFDKPYYGENAPKREFAPRGERFDKRGAPNFGAQGKSAPDAAYAPAGFMDARRVALNALADVDRADAYAALALDKRLRESRLSPEDKRLATSIFYAAIENKLNIEYVLKQFVQVEPEPIIREILTIACAQILFMDRVPDHAVVDEAVKQARVFKRDEAAGFVNGTLRNLLRTREAGEIIYPDAQAEPIKHMSIEYSMPEYIITRLIEAYDFDTARQIVCFRPEKRLETIRPNYLRMDDEAFREYLSARGFDWQPGITPGAYLLNRSGSLTTDPDYYDGIFSVQGESSMLAARAVEPKPGMTILDTCAAPGGKAALMAELMRGTGRVHAWDVHEHRVELIKAMSRRLKLDNLRPAARDASIPREDMEGTMDAVLVDAPCSGLGVMTDKPDIKYRVSEQSILELVKLQAKILDACAAYVREGGLLVYSTCSILPEENEKQAEAFLRAHPEFKLETSDAYLPDALKARMQNGMLTLLPNRDGMEGFFIARMRRV